MRCLRSPAFYKVSICAVNCCFCEGRRIASMAMFEYGVEVVVCDTQ